MAEALSPKGLPVTDRCEGDGCGQVTLLEEVRFPHAPWMYEMLCADCKQATLLARAKVPKGIDEHR